MEDATEFSPPEKIVVLYADLAGSTQLYEKLGDTMAHDSVGQALVFLSRVARGFKGRVKKDIGDEILCAFDDPGKAMLAASQMQSGLRQFNESGGSGGQALRVRIGFHYGLCHEQSDDVLGEAGFVAASLVQLAKADQILSSIETIETLPKEVIAPTRFFDRVHVDGRSESVEVVEVLWEVTGATQVARTSARPRQPQTGKLLLRFNQDAYELSLEKPKLKMGRGADNDLVVETNLTSRFHAELSIRNGKFYLSDCSANGTLVVPESGGETRLRREKTILRGSGLFCLGGDPTKNPAGIIRYECE